MEGTLGDFAKKGGMVDGIEGLRVVDSDCCGAGAWLQLVEADADGGGKGKKSRGS